MPEDIKHSRPSGFGIAALLLLPSFLLAWPGPGAILRDVFAATELTATGAALLATLPMGIYALWRSSVRRPNFFGLWLPCLVLAMFAEQISKWELTDTLEASRAQWVLYTAAVATFAGAAASSPVRRAFLRGTMLLSITLSLWALVSPTEGSLTGILGNTGELASAALFGAVIGARAIVREASGWKFVGGAAMLCFAIQSAAAPSIANVIAFLIGTLTCALLEPTSKRERWVRLAVCFVPLVGLLILKAPAPALDGGQPQQSEDVLGGVGVRALIATATFEMIDEAPFLGVGPGQFVVEFPQHRRVDEINASTNRADARYYTEVEHPHQDYLLVLSEYGALGGGFWLAFWLIAGLRCFVVLRRGDTYEAALAAALIAVLAGSFANAPLGTNPTAFVPAFVAMGMLMSRRVSSKSKLASRVALPGALMLLLLISVPRAWSVVQHGRALAAIGSESEPDAELYQASLIDALEACPDSEVARSLAARLSTRLNQESEQTLNAWRGVLELRPYRIEALLEASRQLARGNDFAAAEKLTQHALELDSENTTALRNLARYAFYAGRISKGEEMLSALEERGLFDEAYALSLAASLILGGQDREGLAVLERVSPEWAKLDGDLAWVEADKHKAEGEKLLRDAFLSFAHLYWAREQAASGNPARAIAVYRQNLRITRDYVPGGPTRVLMELCAAQWLADKRESAAETARHLTPRAADWASLPHWAGDALTESRLFP